MVKSKKVGRKGDDDLYPKRVILVWPNGRKRIAYHKDLVPFDELAPDDYLDTSDLQQYFGVSARTLYRWIAENDLEPDGKMGREFLFEKRTVQRWEEIVRSADARGEKGATS